jgi:hypothetical protein
MKFVKTLIFDFELWLWSLTLSFDFDLWLWSLALIFDFDRWLWSLTLIVGFDLWLWSLALIVGFDRWLWLLALIVGFDRWLWSLALALGFGAHRIQGEQYFTKSNEYFCPLTKFFFQRRKILFGSQCSWVKKSSFIHTMKPINLELHILHQPITTSEPDDDIDTVGLIFSPFSSSWTHTHIFNEITH